MADLTGPAEEESDGDLARQIAALPAQEARDAEGRLYARFARRVYLYGLRHLRDETRAEDLVQEVMTIVLERLRVGAVREPDRVASFVLGTARLCAHGHRRRERRRDELAARLAREGTGSFTPPEPLEHPRLVACLGALAERERAVVVLSFHHEQSGDEIGAALGLSAGNVRVIRHRALARLARCMGLADEEAP